jgi:hypothetical protein
VDALITIPIDFGAVTVLPLTDGPSGMQDAELAQLATDLREQVASLSGLSVNSLGNKLQDYLERRNMESWDDEEEMMVRLPSMPSLGKHLLCVFAVATAVLVLNRAGLWQGKMAVCGMS